jgi:transcription elongation factor GreA
MKTKLFVLFFYNPKNFKIMGKYYTTKSGYQKLIDEINHISTTEMRNSLLALTEAREKGDISENAEYESAKEHHQNLSIKLTNLQKKLRNVEIVSTPEAKDKITMLSTAKIKNYKTNQIVEWTLVPESDINIKEGKISFKSPIGKGLMNKKVGDVVDVEVPIGIIRLEILDIL